MDRISARAIFRAQQALISLCHHSVGGRSTQVAAKAGHVTDLITSHSSHLASRRATIPPAMLPALLLAWPAQKVGLSYNPYAIGSPPMSSQVNVKAGDVVIRRGPFASVFVQIVSDDPQEPWEAIDYAAAIHFARWMVAQTHGRLWEIAAGRHTESPAHHLGLSLSGESS